MSLFFFENGELILNTTDRNFTIPLTGSSVSHWYLISFCRGRTGALHGTPKQYKGLGKVTTSGRRSVTFGIKADDVTSVSGTLMSNELNRKDTPLLDR